MIKNNVRIKEDITIKDKANTIECIVDGCFMENPEIGSGYMDYVPYFYDMVEEIAFAKYLIEGLEFDKDENIYDTIHSDQEVMYLIDCLKKDYKVLRLLSVVDNKLEFEKQLIVNNNRAIFESIIRNSDSIENKVKEILDKESKRIDMETKALKATEFLSKEQARQIEYANKVNEHFSPEETAELTRKMADANFDSSSIANAISEKYFKSEKHADNVKSINAYKKNKESIKNVLSDSKDKE